VQVNNIDGTGDASRGPAAFRKASNASFQNEPID